MNALLTVLYYLQSGLFVPNPRIPQKDASQSPPSLDQWQPHFKIQSILHLVFYVLLCGEVFTSSLGLFVIPQILWSISRKFLCCGLFYLVTFCPRPCSISLISLLFCAPKFYAVYSHFRHLSRYFFP